ncbi:MAG: DUF1064 domain-containing protein [Paludibacteraceae bacterium]|nr:DUF1064 domain-containing protein [Paludibacteraceae bacterium]
MANTWKGWGWYPPKIKGAVKSKYGAKKTVVDGTVFDSKKEAKRFLELKTMEKAGIISDLQRQVKFLLIPAQRDAETIGPKGGKKPGRLLEREVSYYADFCYKVDGVLIVEDTKGVRTPEYVLKRKMMLWIHGIRIKEI